MSTSAKPNKQALGDYEPKSLPFKGKYIDVSKYISNRRSRRTYSVNIMKSKPLSSTAPRIVDIKNSDCYGE